MATEEIEILHIEGVLSSLSKKQIGIEATPDADLGFRMWGGKDNDGTGTVTKFLAKGQDAYIDELRLEGPTTIGEIGMLKHDTNGDITGGQITVDYFNTNILSDGPVGGGDVLGSGTANTLAIWTDTDTIGDSTITKSSNLYSVNSESTSHSVTNGIVLSQLEVNGQSYFDGILYAHNDIIVYDTIRLQDDVPLYLGDATDTKILYNHTDQTSDTLMFGLSSDSYGMIVCRKVDMTTDYGLGPFTDPTIVLKGAGTVVDEYTTLSDGLIKTGAGTHDLLLNLDGYTGNLVIGTDITTASGDQENIIIGNNITLANSCNSSIISGSDISADNLYASAASGIFLTVGGNYNAIFGHYTEHTGDYGLSFGSHNINDQDYAISHGRYARTYWPGRFFSGAPADGSTEGSAQCFDSLSLFRHTEATDQVVMTFDGTGSASPIEVNDGEHITLECALNASYEGTGGVEYWKWKLHAWGTPTTSYRLNWDTEENYSMGGGCGSASWSISGRELRLRVTPATADAINWQAHVSFGTKVPTGYMGSS